MHNSRLQRAIRTIRPGPNSGNDKSGIAVLPANLPVAVYYGEESHVRPTSQYGTSDYSLQLLYSNWCKLGGCTMPMTA